MTGPEKLVWSHGPEARTRRWGCIKLATWGKHTWEIHRTYERSLISGRNLVMSQLFMDGKRIGGNYSSFTDAMTKANEMRAELERTEAGA